MIDFFRYVWDDGPVGKALSVVVLFCIVWIGILFGIIVERIAFAPNQCETGKVLMSTVDPSSINMIPNGQGGFVYLYDDTDGVILVDIGNGEFADPQVELVDLMQYTNGQTVTVCRHVGAVSGMEWSWYMDD